MRACTDNFVPQGSFHRAARISAYIMIARYTDAVGCVIATLFFAYCGRLWPCPFLAEGKIATLGPHALSLSAIWWGTVANCPLQLGPTHCNSQLPTTTGAYLRYCNSLTSCDNWGLSARVAVHVCLKYRLGFDPTKTPSMTTTTQQPNFSMEFQGGNDCSSVALVSSIIYSSLGSFPLRYVDISNLWEPPFLHSLRAPPWRILPLSVRTLPIGP
jgi:hypothetical protein